MEKIIDLKSEYKKQLPHNLTDEENNFFSEWEEYLNYLEDDEYPEKNFVLSTDIKELNERIVFKQKDGSGALDRYFRLRAAQEIGESNQADKLLLVGGCNKNLNKFRTEAMKEYLMNEGLDKELLKELRCCPGNTVGNMIEILKYIDEHNQTEYGLITNLYHLPRAMAIGELLLKRSNSLEFDSDSLPLKPVPAEFIIWEDDNEKEIKNFYESEAMNKRIKNEIKGYRDASNGDYDNCEWPLEVN